MNDLRARIAQSDPHFTTTLFKFYYMEVGARYKLYLLIVIPVFRTQIQTQSYLLYQ